MRYKLKDFLAIAAFGAFVVLSFPAWAATDTNEVIRRAVSENEQENYKAAEALFTQVIDYFEKRDLWGTYPDQEAYVRANRAYSFFRLRRYEEALSDANRAIGITENRDYKLGSSVYLYRGSTHLRLGDVKSAISDFDRSLALEPGQPYALYERGFARFSVNNFDGAKSDFEELLKAEPSSSRPHVFLGMIYGSEQDAQACCRSLK
jgi:tetratricopeptide (TPR) repeat protein